MSKLAFPAEGEQLFLLSFSFAFHSVSRSDLFLRIFFLICIKKIKKTVIQEEKKENLAKQYIIEKNMIV